MSEYAMYDDDNYTSSDFDKDDKYDKEKEIEELKKELSLLKKEKEDRKLLEEENYIFMNKVKKLIKIIYGYTNMIQYYEEIYTYGPLLESLLRHKKLKNKDLYMLIPKLEIRFFLEIVNRLNDMDLITNEDYNINKELIIANKKDIYHINMWKLNIIFENGMQFRLILHDNTFKEDIMFDCHNLVLTRGGLTIQKFTDNDIKYSSFNSSISLLDSLTSIINNRAGIINKCKSNNMDEIFLNIEKQNELMKDNYIITNGYKVDTKKDVTCSICYREHKEDNSYLYKLNCNHTFCSECLYKHMTTIELNNNEKCPLCRTNIEIQYI